MMTPRVLLILAISAADLYSQLSGGKWRTDTSRHSVALSELTAGGPGKDGIPALASPKFVSVGDARRWLDPREPAIAVELSGEVRVYPIQILIWHELVDDEIGGTPILVSYCPLCNSAVVFDRRIEGRVLDFAVSGMLRNSDMVMFDRQTETLWQQLTGEAIVGDLTGKQLRVLSSQTLAFGMLADHFPNARVLSRDTGYSRNYGTNPYVGYEFGNQVMYPVRVRSHSRVPLLERIVTITDGERTKAYRFSTLRRLSVAADQLGSLVYVIFFSEAVRSALDAERIADSRDVGAVGVFSPEIKGRYLTFFHRAGTIQDAETGSSWNIFGTATAGPLAGEHLKPLQHTVAFAFAWLAFRPSTEIVALVPSTKRARGRSAE